MRKIVEYIIRVLYFGQIVFLELRYLLNRRKELEELKEFADFLSDLCYEFELHKNVSDAIYFAAENVHGKLKKSLDEISFLLEEEEAEGDAAEFHYPSYLKQLKLFFIQCRNAVMYGSGKKGQKSVFVRNMTELRRDVQNECMKRGQAAFLFAGLGLIAAVPVLFLSAVSTWGSDNMPELLDFYKGTAGRVIAAAVTLLSVVCYLFLALVRKVDGSFYRRPVLVQKFFESRPAELFSSWFQGKAAEKTGQKRLEEAGIYRSGGEYFYSCCILGGCFLLLAVWLVRKESAARMLLAGAIAFFAGFAGMMGTYRYLAYLRQLGRTGEVLGLQSIILMLFEAPNMTIMKLLTIMEEYASVFQRELGICADRYTAEEEDAFLKLMAKEIPQEFKRLIHRIYISERLGLVHAFSELSADRQYFREQQRMDTEQELQKRAANAQVVAFLPMFFLLFAYLIFPFLAASLAQMAEIFLEMNQMKMF